ncbi:Adrenodoxin [Trichoplax sp. H2]|nr:Adrenodoxin [Trichoplax sp. H2]|eukprot:RDD45963.1 Adrenodoxin [Trichoplax sp. H2]
MFHHSFIYSTVQPVLYITVNCVQYTVHCTVQYTVLYCPRVWLYSTAVLGLCIQLSAMALMASKRILSSSTRNFLALTEILRSRSMGTKDISSSLKFSAMLNQGRCFSVTPRQLQNKVTINFVERDGEVVSVKAKLGETLLDVAKDYDISLEGACEGTLACSTCHLILKPEIYETLPEPTDEELDMLDLAFGLSDTSRLGCQITITQEMDNMTVEVPKESYDVRQ